LYRDDEDKGLVYFSATEHSHIAPQEYRIKIDGTGLTRLTPAEGSHRVDLSPADNYFVDKWSDVNTPTQTRLYDADGKLIRVISENKVDALKDYKLGTTELLQVKTGDGFLMEAMMIKPPDFDSHKKYPVMTSPIVVQTHRKSVMRGVLLLTCGINSSLRKDTSYGSVTTARRAARALSRVGRLQELRRVGTTRS